MNPGILAETVRQLKHLPRQEVRNVLENETSRFEITRSLLNLLFNVCFTRSIHLNQQQLRQFRTFEPVVTELLDRPRSTTTGRYQEPDLRQKQRLFLRHLRLVQLLSRVCPTPAQLLHLTRLHTLRGPSPTSNVEEGEEPRESSHL